VKEKEMEALIDEAAVGLALEFRDKFPLGFLENAVHHEITYIGRITALFEGRLRELIPYAFDPKTFAPTETLPVLEGVIVADASGEEV
jgi:hypothetical protein